jgi:hypothetical protein
MPQVKPIDSLRCALIRPEVERQLTLLKSKGGEHKETVRQLILVHYTAGVVKPDEYLLEQSVRFKETFSYRLAVPAVKRLLSHNGYKGRPRFHTRMRKENHPFWSFPFSLDLEINAEQWKWLEEHGWEFEPILVEKETTLDVLTYKQPMNRVKLLSSYAKLMQGKTKWALLCVHKDCNVTPEELKSKLDSSGANSVLSRELLEHCDDLHQLVDFIRTFPEGRPIVIVVQPGVYLPELFGFITEASGLYNGVVTNWRSKNNHRGVVSTLNEWLVTHHLTPTK